jgi:hypothetical protein
MVSSGRTPTSGLGPLAIAMLIGFVGGATGTAVLLTGDEVREPGPDALAPPNPSDSSRASSSPRRPGATPVAITLGDGDPSDVRVDVRAGGIPFSFELPPRWEDFGREYPYISKSVVGPQGAEAKIMWAADPENESAAPCDYLRRRPFDGSVADLARVVSEVPGTDLVEGPSETTVGGLPAMYVEFVVRGDVGCDPGFFFTYPNVWGGALWPETVAGDRIRVWLVSVDGDLFFVEGATKVDAGRILEEEVQEIVDSIEFE